MSNDQPIAQIFCRYIEKSAPRHFPLGGGFRNNRARREAGYTAESLDILLFLNDVIRVGRDIENNDISIMHPFISRQHFVIYSVEYEEGMRPLIYVRDYNSLCGTYVDSRFRLPMPVPRSSGHLLSQSEIIRLIPHWEFHVYLLGVRPVKSIMSQLRLTETDRFQNRFLITRQMLGSGALADVHLAINLETGRQVACKIHQLDRFRQPQGSPRTIRRILDETDILSRLSHPNILKFVAAFRSSDTLYTFTELATGGDLFSRRLKYPNGLPEIDTKFIIRQIVEAISYLHDQNIVHRDLKPENVFFATGPELKARVIVGDFGFAKVAKSGRMTSEIGTRRFIAPEIYYGQRYGAEVDIWSIGMISVFLVAIDWNDMGCFETLDQDTVDKGLSITFDDLSKRGNTSSDLKDFIRACLSITPSKRVTANASKMHSWFKSSRPQLEIQIGECMRGWEASQVSHNTVEDLDLLESTEAQKIPSLKKRTMQDDRNVAEDTPGPHSFANIDSTNHKRQRIVQSNLVIKVTRTREENIHLDL